jgi:hypothetical protein
MTEIQPLGQERTAQTALCAFNEICTKFKEISRSVKPGQLPIYGGPWALQKDLVMHPLRTYAALFRHGFRSEVSIGVLVSSFPTEAMIGFLNRYSEPELRAAKALSEIQLRRMKSLLTDNPVLKISGLTAVIYALAKISNELITIRGSVWEQFKSVLASPPAQGAIEFLFYILISVFVGLLFQFLYQTIPEIKRAQILDDMLLVALEEKHLEQTRSAGNLPTHET